MSEVGGSAHFNACNGDQMRTHRDPSPKEVMIRSRPYLLKFDWPGRFARIGRAMYLQCTHIVQIELLAHVRPVVSLVHLTLPIATSSVMIEFGKPVPLPASFLERSDLVAAPEENRRKA